ncbi:MAG: FtsX-like permease family protein, partial [Blastocatellia bacterium]
IKLVVNQNVALTTLGMAIGLLGVFALTRFLSSLLYQVSPTDLFTLVLVALTLLVTALLACYLPAYRMTKIDPLIVLRNE